MPTKESDRAGAPQGAESLEGRVLVYLVPEHPSGEAETPPLEDYYSEIFESEQEAWSTIAENPPAAPRIPQETFQCAWEH